MKRLGSIPWSRAVTEFVVIFLGVTISLLADDWRQGQEARGAEVQTLRTILEDLEDDSVELDRFGRWMRRWDEDALWMYRHFGDRAADPDIAILHAGRLMSQSTYHPAAAAYVGLKSGEGLTLLSDVRVRREMVQYYELGYARMEELGVLVASAQLDYMDVMAPHLRPLVAEDAKAFFPFSGIRFFTSWDSVSVDPSVRVAIEILGSHASNLGHLAEAMIAENAELRRQIREDLEHS